LDARLYLLDEPFTGIDLARIRLLMDYLRALPVPVLLSTHEPEVLALAHRVIHLEGPPLTILK
jgi:energy-coupling factor transporter ATP-binding protein EcfA2